MGLDISALLKRGIVYGTSYFECVLVVAMSRVDTNPLGLLSSASKLSTMTRASPSIVWVAVGHCYSGGILTLVRIS